MATDLGKVGMRMRGTWDSSTAYEVLDAVSYNNGLYIAKQAVPANTVPTNTTYWQEAVAAQSNTYNLISVNNGITTLKGLFEALAGDLRNVGYGNIGSSQSSDLKTLIGTATFSTYAAARIIWDSPDSLKVVARSSFNTSNAYVYKYIYRHGSSDDNYNYYLTDWQSLNANS